MTSYTIEQNNQESRVVLSGDLTASYCYPSWVIGRAAKGGGDNE